MGKIYSSSKHSNQERKVPYMGKGPEMSYKIQKRQNTPCKVASMHTEENSSEIDIPTDPVIGTPSQIFTDSTYTAAVTHTDSEGEVTHKTNFLGKYCKYCNRCREAHCWCFTSDWEDGLDANNPNSSWRYSHLQQPGSPLQAGPKIDAESLKNEYNRIPITKRRNQH